MMNGVIMAIKGFLSFLSAPLLGSLSDVWGRKLFLLITAFFTCLPIPFLLVRIRCIYNCGYHFYLFSRILQYILWHWPSVVFSPSSSVWRLPMYQMSQMSLAGVWATAWSQLGLPPPWSSPLRWGLGWRWWPGGRTWLSSWPPWRLCWMLSSSFFLSRSHSTQKSISNHWHSNRYNNIYLRFLILTFCNFRLTPFLLCNKFGRIRQCWLSALSPSSPTFLKLASPLASLCTSH